MDSEADWQSAAGWQPAPHGSQVGRAIVPAAAFQHPDAPEARCNEPLAAPTREFGLLKTKGFGAASGEPALAKL